jgi:hypothetical protein
MPAPGVILPVVPVVYIAGPYRAPTPRRILANIWTAQEAALAVWRAGGVAICPHANTALFDGEADDAVWLAGDLELLRRSDAVLMCGAWGESEGATAEHAFAYELGLPIFYDTLDRNVLARWIADWTRTERAEGL